MRWRYTKDGEIPQNQDSMNSYGGHVACLVEMVHFDYKVLCYNVYEHCWDDDEGDDYYCDTYEVKRWIPIKELTEEREAE